jgi:tungstate transport system ATP-binding protein
MDEPFSALDPIMRETLLEDLEKVLRETRITTIFVTHDRTEALRLATRLGVMNAGEILQTGSPDEVMNHPVNEFVASLVGVENLLQGRVTKENQGSFVASVSGQDIEAMGTMKSGDPVTLCIRPENVILSDLASGTLAGRRNSYPANVLRITPMGPYHKVQLNCGFPLVTYATGHSISALSIKQGSEVLASFDSTVVHVIRKKE